MNMPERLVLDLGACGVAEIPLLGRYSHRAARRELGLHRHRGTLEICYLARGRQLYEVGGRAYLLRGGDVFVTFPGERHSSGDTPQEKGVLYWMQVKLPRRSGRFLGCAPREGRALISQLRHLPNRHFAGTPGLRRLLDELIAAGRQPDDPLSRLVVQNRSVDFLLRVMMLARRDHRVVVSQGIGTVLGHIESNLAEKLPLQRLAALAGLSLPRFKSRFAREVGVPPGEYVMRRRIALAERHLRHSDVPITQMAMDLNFASSQYFATVFKRYTGRRPGDVRRRAAVRRRSGADV
jgi:AraC-like DNA-binding protein